MADSSISTSDPLTAIPAELTELPQWIGWRLIQRGGKLDKLPFQVHKPSENASSTDPSTWTTFTNAVDASANFTGIGFVFSETDPFCGIDLDGCRDPESGTISEWAANWIDSFNSYTEVSPSKTGVKIFVRGHHNFGADKTGRKNDKLDVPRIDGVSKTPGVEIYDHGRYFAVTGDILDDYTLTTCEPRQKIIDEFCSTYFPPYVPPKGTQRNTPPNVHERAAKYLAKMDGAISGSDGHGTTFHVACVLVLGFALTPEQAFPILAEWNAKCEPPWTDHELQHKLDDANKEGGERGYLLNIRDEYRHNGNGRQYDESEAYGHDDATPEVESEQPAKPATLPKILTFDELEAAYPNLRPVVIDGIARRGDTTNIIAPPKEGKSWCVLGIAFSVATGLPWLGRFDCEPGRVLIIDNELHPSDIRWRLRQVAKAMEIQDVADWRPHIDVLPLRGDLQNVYNINLILSDVKPGTYDLVILDAWYRALPKGVSENENAAIGDIYNLTDQITKRLGCAWINIHHSSKGNQSGKSVVDVGAGAGSQSRAADAHIILREHQEPGFSVLEGKVRTFPPIVPVALQWEWPLWKVALDIDPSKLAGLLTTGEKKRKASDTEGMEAVCKALKAGDATCREIRRLTGGMGQPRCERLLDMLESDGRVTSVETIRRGNTCRLYHLVEDVVRDDVPRDRTT